MDKRVSYGAMRPGFNTPVGRELFRICEDWIGVLCLGVCSMVCLGDGFCHFFIEIQIKLLPILWSSTFKLFAPVLYLYDIMSFTHKFILESKMFGPRSNQSLESMMFCTEFWVSNTNILV